MKRNAGFTLVELLVVMAIITILASIAIPNVVNYIRQGQSTRALADINSIETALTEVLADAQRSNLEQLFDPAGVASFMVSQKGLQNWPPVSAQEFAQAAELYTRALTGVLRSGRNVLGSGNTADSFGFTYPQILVEDVVAKLGTGYIDIGFDPWGNLYNIYPGPWTARLSELDPGSGQVVSRRALIPFRIYTKSDTEQKLPGASAVQADGLVSDYEDPDSATISVGYPAQGNQIAFIWSNGQNLLSSQVLYSGTGYNLSQPIETFYDQGQGPDFKGGGDDINNWDPANSWGRFY
jgi:prepilin-type N-terminal cleavage/methylation domain-containing protein